MGFPGYWWKTQSRLVYTAVREFAIRSAADNRFPRRKFTLRTANRPG
jgi:hypothetical protein